MTQNKKEPFCKRQLQFLPLLLFIATKDCFSLSKIFWLQKHFVKKASLSQIQNLQLHLNNSQRNVCFLTHRKGRTSQVVAKNTAFSGNCWTSTFDQLGTFCFHNWTANISFRNDLLVANRWTLQGKMIVVKQEKHIFQKLAVLYKNNSLPQWNCAWRHCPVIVLSKQTTLAMLHAWNIHVVVILQQEFHVTQYIMDLGFSAFSNLRWRANNFWPRLTIWGDSLQQISHFHIFSRPVQIRTQEESITGVLCFTASRLPALYIIWWGCAVPYTLQTTTHNTLHSLFGKWVQTTQVGHMDFVWFLGSDVQEDFWLKGPKRSADTGPPPQKLHKSTTFQAQMWTSLENQELWFPRV